MKKNKIIQLLIFSGVFLTMLIACQSNEVAESKDVNQEKIYHSYQVILDEEEKSLETEAQFRFGGNKGTTLILSSPAEIRVNGKKMKGLNGLFKGYYYFYNELPFQSSSIEFTYRDIHQKKYTWTLTPAHFGKIQYPESMSSEGEYLISWDGLPLGKNEKVELIINGKDNEKWKLIAQIEAPDKIRFNIPTSADVPPGKYTIQLVRNYSQAIHENELEGGIIKMKTISESLPCRIVSKL